ncbi:putative short-chain dehydrogenase [Hibiscus syriacus]|uniref:Short-chain dehydrogenase n=1 Tax=Hibiscus syriacus TaxID=106335 RepID=A0A6A3B371_HIBSY|nr:putative short-chain dehydrogenase [Hibiscus syriacus]
MDATGGVYSGTKQWLVGFHQNIGRCSAFQAEFWALFDGLTLAWNRGIKDVEAELDNKEAVDTLNDTPHMHEASIIGKQKNSSIIDQQSGIHHHISLYNPGRFMARWLQLIQALTWALLLTLMVSIASFIPEMAFVSAVSPSSSFSRSCNAEGLVRIP